MTKGGQTTRLRVRPRQAPFDVQLGRWRDGRLVAVYSRCVRERGSWSIPLTAAGGCRLWAYDFSTRKERALHVVAPRHVTPMFLRQRHRGHRQRAYESPASVGEQHLDLTGK